MEWWPTTKHDLYFCWWWEIGYCLISRLLWLCGVSPQNVPRVYSYSVLGGMVVSRSRWVRLYCQSQSPISSLAAGGDLANDKEICCVCLYCIVDEIPKWTPSIFPQLLVPHFYTHACENGTCRIFYLPQYCCRETEQSALGTGEESRFEPLWHHRGFPMLVLLGKGTAVRKLAESEATKLTQQSDKTTPYSHS